MIFVNSIEEKKANNMNKIKIPSIAFDTKLTLRFHFQEMVNINA